VWNVDDVDIGDAKKACVGAGHVEIYLQSTCYKPKIALKKFVKDKHQGGVLRSYSIYIKFKYR
jgi:hypothetical protein